MFILIDTTLENFPSFWDHINELDDKPVLALADLEDLSDYTPGGSFHILDLLSESKELSRWDQLVMASLGVRVFTDSAFDETSPIYAGRVPATSSKLRRISVDAANAEKRALHFASYGVNYIGRTKLDPRNIFVLDNRKGNPLHDPEKDPLLGDLYGSLPEDWWGSCGFVSTGNVEKLKTFLDEKENVIPITWTVGGKGKLNYAQREFVEVQEPTSLPEYGIEVRELANRLSYKLSDPEEEPPAATDGFKWVI